VAIALNLLSVVSRAFAWDTTIKQSIQKPHPRFRLVFSAFSVVLFANAVLPARAGELAQERPVVAVCRSGARSAQAVVLLQKAGFKDVANLAGGMLRWRAEGNPVDGGRE